ncbi:rhomboid family intramembrane serine protease [Desulfovibrio sp. UCD-KL4C]|uniref:rhomboid family intramembrane serine protease n=1 Tax=Desulfovibrio sp. UCD-KL4C TaxID=2578120 RepID=UPI0025C13BED|nr:rhomboid family intramembrane serine protease [Desulfovibrio sp. UCD-KL4C]
MIPIRDNVPCLIRPYILWALMAANITTFLMELLLAPKAKLAIFHLLGVVPARYINPEWAIVAGYPSAGILPFFTYMFLHSGWLHIILNLWMLWIFADNIEDAMGHVRFFAFYIICGLSAILIQILLTPSANAPIIGASGAVAGIMGAYFVLYPHGRVLTLIPIIIIPLFFKIPAGLFLGIWFSIQVFSGFAEHISDGAKQIAWGAHIGGFVTGLILVRFFIKKDRCKYCYDPAKKDYELDEDF